MSSATTPAIPAPLASSDGRLLQKFHVILTVDPNVLRNDNEVLGQFLFASNGSPTATARLNNFKFNPAAGGGPGSYLYKNGTARGDFTRGFQFSCWKEAPPPQVLFNLQSGTTSLSFDIAISTKASRPDWFTVWFQTIEPNWPTSADRPSLFAAVNWAPGGVFTTAGFNGTGLIPGTSLNDTGFSGSVTQLPS